MHYFTLICCFCKMPSTLLVVCGHAEMALFSPLLGVASGPPGSLSFLCNFPFSCTEMGLRSQHLEKVPTASSQWWPAPGSSPVGACLLTCPRIWAVPPPQTLPHCLLTPPGLLTAREDKNCCSYETAPVQGEVSAAAASLFLVLSDVLKSSHET